MREKPQILGREVIARTRLFRIEGLDLRFSNGIETRYECLGGTGHGAVLVVPLLDQETVLLVREYAAGVDRYELMLPKGLIELNETPLEAANREMMEEIGYAAKSLQEINQLTMAPGYAGFVTHIVLAKELYEKRLPGDEPEDLEVVPWRLDQLPALIARPDCTEARSIAALFITREILYHGM